MNWCGMMIHGQSIYCRHVMDDIVRCLIPGVLPCASCINLYSPVGFDGSYIGPFFFGGGVGVKDLRDDNKTRTHLQPTKSPHLKPKWVVEVRFKRVWGGYGKNG